MNARVPFWVALLGSIVWAIGVLLLPAPAHAQTAATNEAVLDLSTVVLAVGCVLAFAVGYVGGRQR